jgi:single-stranded-DNA-specific exonuclease
MLLARAKWNVKETDRILVQELSQKMQLNPLIVSVLINRNITSVMEIERFLSSDIDQLADPFLFAGMDVAVRRVQQAILRKEKIRIYGDYDADGVSSTVLMIHLFRTLGAQFDYYIPHRTLEGYGLNAEAIQAAKDAGIDLIVTVDNGISAVQEVELIHELGMEIIITDHHEPPEELPRALSILNPKQAHCSYPFKSLAGVGVAFKFAHALLGRPPVEFLEYVTIGTVADLMPLLGENRLLVQQGLSRMQQSTNLGIQALMEVSHVDPQKISAGLIGYALAPKINASGRLEHADEAVRLLTTSDRDEAMRIAIGLDELNKERQQLVETITNEAITQANSLMAHSSRRVIVVASENWNVGVVGIVASKLVERYYRPSLVLSIDVSTGIAKGSARSIHSFDLYQALSHCNQWLTHYGGHHAAAGLTIPIEHLPSFIEKIERWAHEKFTEEDFVPMLHADFYCQLHEVTVPLIEQLNRLGPFGMGHPAPKVVLTELKVAQTQMIGKEKQHLKLTCEQIYRGKKYKIDALGFNRSQVKPYLSADASLNLLAELSINEWNNQQSAQLIIQDISVEHIQVFDWRDTRDGDLKVIQFTRDHMIAPAHLMHHPPALICVTELMNDSAPHHDIVQVNPIWICNQVGAVEPFNQQANVTSLSDMTDVVLYHIPHDYDTIMHTLQMFPNARRYYIVAKDKEKTTNQMTEVPSREMFGLLYKWALQQNQFELKHDSPIHIFCEMHHIQLKIVTWMINVFVELEFIRYADSSYIVNPSVTKKELESSLVYQRYVDQQAYLHVMHQASSSSLTKWMVECITSNVDLKEELS